MLNVKKQLTSQEINWENIRMVKNILLYCLPSVKSKWEKIEKEHSFDDFTCVNVTQNMCASSFCLDSLDYIPIIRLRRFCFHSK